MGEADYYLLIGGQEEGPWTLGQVQAFWRAGALTLETLYAQPDMPEWKPISAIVGAASPAAPTPPPRPESAYADEQRKIIDTVVNVMLPVEDSAVNPEADAAADEPAEPEEIDLPKARQWLRDTLVGLGFDTAKEAAERERFDEWLTRFSSDEQTALFGAENLKHYRREDWTWRDLISGLESSPTSAAQEPQGNAKQLTPENALWIMEMVWRIEQVATNSGRIFTPMAVASLRADQDVQALLEASGETPGEAEHTRRLDATDSEISDNEMPVGGKAKVEAEFLSQVGVPVVTTAADYQQEKNQPKTGKWISKEGRLVSVEDIATEWYQSRGYSVLRCEGRIISVWVATFLANAVQDRNDPRLRTGFRTSTRDSKPHRQNAPLISILLPDDFASAGYYQRREDAIQANIQQMRSTQNLQILFDELLDRSESLRDYLWVNDDEPVKAARIALNIVPRELVIASVNWAIKQFWQRRCGWPDLFVYNADSFAFSEVKSPHDHLRPEQMDWFRWAIEESHIPCELCHVAKR
jgi:hypothetical protein